MAKANSAESLRPQSSCQVLVHAIAIAVSCVAITQLVFPAHFETTDDLNFSLLLSGVGLTHAPTYQTWFTNILITYPLMWLFEWLPTVPWYSIYLFAVLIFALTIIATVLMLRFNRSVGAAFFLVYYVLAGAFIVNGLQYTSTTALLAQSAFLLAFCLPVVKRFRANKFPKWITGTAVVATVFASMIRFEPFLLVLLISLLTVLVIVPWRLEILKRNGKTFAWFAIAVILGFALKTASNYYYDSQPAFAGVRAFFQPFSALADSDREKQPEVKTALTDNDFSLVKQFFVADKKIFTTETLSNAVSASYLPFTGRKLAWTLSTSIAPVLLFSLSIAWLLDMSIISKPRFMLWMFGMISLILYLSFFMKLPARIHLTLLTCAMTTLIMFIDRIKLKRIIYELLHGSAVKRRAVCAGLVALAGLLTYWSASLLYDDYQQHYEEEMRIKAAINRLAPKPKQLYIILGTTTPYQYMSPFTDLRPLFQGFDIYRTSLWSRMPVGDQMLKLHGFNNLMEACHSKDVLFISNPNANDRFAQFLKEHFQMNAKFKRVFNEPDLNLNIYSLVLNSTGN